MEDGHVNSYYALVWNTSLNSKMELRGTKITRSTKLPNDPRMLYGTNGNDVAKIRKVNLWQEVEYDPATTKQAVKFWEEIDEYILSRDIYIVVWEGESTLCLPQDRYKIVTPEFFDDLKSFTESEQVDSSEQGEQIWLENELKLKTVKNDIFEQSFHSQPDGKLTMQTLSF